MNIVCISDTHGKHPDLELPEGDILLHAGDVSNRGAPHEIRAFVKWFASQPHKHKVFIAGNHDFFFERASAMERIEMLDADVTYLNDAHTTIEGIKIWGSPVQPRFFNWAFNRDRGADIARHWARIPNDTDILLVHGPPYGILDRTSKNQQVGCADLYKAIERVQPRLCVFGHIHESHGQMRLGNTLCVNAAVVSHSYKLTRQATVINWEELIAAQ